MLDKIKGYFFDIILKKVIVRCVRLVVAWAAANKLNEYGVVLNEQELTLAAYAGVTALVNLLKRKYPNNKFISAL